MQLRSKYVNVDDACPSCQQERETTYHCLVSCSFARSCWERVGIGVLEEETNNFCSWFSHVLQHLEEERQRVLVMICWVLWKVRNDLVWNQKGSTVSSVLTLAHNFLDHWLKDQDKVHVLAVAFSVPEDGSDRWRRPDVNTLKINVDAALFEDIGNFSYACVARDNAGSVIEAISCCRVGHLAVEMAEALGVREALSWIKQKGWKDVIIESDSLTLVQSIRSNYPMVSYFGGIVEECKTMLNELESVSILFVRRSVNKVAHAIARASYFIADCVFRGVDLSHEIQNVIMVDLQV